MANFLVRNNFYQGTSQACIVDLTPPTFAGINFLDVESRGQIRSGWSAATDASAPIRYEVYIKASTATGLFNFANIIAVTPNLQYDIFTLPDGSFLQNGVTYFVGVRAIDGVNNRDSNTISQSVISTGVLTTIDTYNVSCSFSNDNNDDFNLTAWADKNGSLAVAPSATVGVANYQVYDENGAAVAGMSGSGISANVNGLFIFPPVADLTNRLTEHYQVRVGIIVDSEERVNYTPIDSFQRNYEIAGIADADATGQIVGSFWINRNGSIVTTGLGDGSYQLFTSDGIALPLTESGISADSNGFFVITPVFSPFPLDPTRPFIVRAVVDIDGHMHEQNLILGNEQEVFDIKAVFSINASNQLRATFWCAKNHEQISGVVLGTASYQVYDASGAAVSGLTQSGLTADGNGYYQITPVLATLITDLTHYTVKITMTVAGYPRIASKAFTLLGT
jgi:hypothetical protein